MNRKPLLLPIILLLLSFSAFSQKMLLEEDFENNKNGWFLQNDSNFRVDISNGFLHLEKREKNFISRGCLWYNKKIQDLNTAKDFSVTIYARYLQGGDIFDAIDIQWGDRGKVVDGRLNSSLYQLNVFFNGEVRLDYFNRNWTYFVRKKVPGLSAKDFDARNVNKYELVQKDSLLVFSINDKEVIKQFCQPIAGNSIGFQQCMKTTWEIDKIIVAQLDQQKKNAPDTSRLQVIKELQIPNPSDKQLKVFPNPFNQYLIASLYLEKEENVQLELIDINGITLQQHNKKFSAGPQYMQLYADVLPGTYFIKVKIGTKVLTATAIKQ